MSLIEQQTDVIEVHNAWSVEQTQDGKTFAQISRPQDWGDPRWHYERFRFEWQLEGKRYINHAHCWTDILVDSPGDYPELFASLIVMALMPGQPEQLCGRDYLAPEDFWQEAWGSLPPVFDPDNEDDQADTDDQAQRYDGISDTELEQLFIAEMQAIMQSKLQPATLQIKPHDAYTLVGLMQLACRHPGCTGYPRQLAEQLVAQITGMFRADSAIGESIRRGWDRQKEEG